MSKIWSFMIISSVVVSFIWGSIAAIPNIIMESCITATENMVKLLGMTCFWSGIFIRIYTSRPRSTPCMP